MLPIIKTPIERPTLQVPVDELAPTSEEQHSSSSQQQNGSSANPTNQSTGTLPAAPALKTVFVKECGLCAPRSGRETWSANPPERPEDEENWVTLLEAKVHASCLAQAFAEKLIVHVPIVERSTPIKTGVEDHRDFATRCLEPQEKMPMVCVIDASCPAYKVDTATLVQQHGDKEIPVTALEPFATGFRLFPEMAPPRTLEDLLQCTSRLNKNGRLSESSEPLDMRSKFPEMFAEVRKSIPVFSMPGGPCDVLAKDSRNRTGASAIKLNIVSPGSVFRAQRSRYRSSSLLLNAGSQIEWASIGYEDAERILETSRESRSRQDLAWIPELTFCLRHNARVYCGQQTQPGQMMLVSPGAIYWGFVRETSTSTLVAQWSFAERSKLAFEYALMDPLSASHPEELRELDLSDARENILNLRTFQEILRSDEERLSLLPKDLAEALVLRLVKACQDMPVDAARSSTSIPADHAKKIRCDECRAELFERRIFCAECEQDGGQDDLIELVATHPPRSSAKKDRSTLPDWLRVGCRVLVNLTVSGNSNDKPPRVIGAAHLPAIILKTGHGFFTVYLEGSGETVVKRKAAIEPHPLGPQLAQGYLVRIKPEGGGNVEPVIQTTPFKSCVFCADCFTKLHASKSHAKKSAVYFDGRLELAKTFEGWKKEILARSAIRKDDLCVWNAKAPLLGDDDAPMQEDALPPCAVIIKTVSKEAGQDAMRLAQIMGPSPYHYPAAQAPSSPDLSSSALMSTRSASVNAGLLNGANSNMGMERRTRTAARKRIIEATLGTSTSEDRGRSESKSSSTGAVTNKRVRSSSSGWGMDQRSSNSSSLMDHYVENDYYTNGTMDSHLSQVGLSHIPATHQGMGLALQSGSFFVGGQKSLSILLEADAIVHAHAELMDANKPEEIRAIWARARMDVPLRKMWKFLAVDATNAAPSTASTESRSLSKREAIHALAESASRAEPAKEVV